MHWTRKGLFLRPWAALALGSALSGALASACGSNEVKEPDEVVGSVQEAATITKDLTITLPIGAGLSEIALGSNDFVRIADRTKILAASSGVGKIASTGAGLTTLWYDVRARDVVSVGDVVLRDRVRVDGSATSQGIITANNTVVITGTRTEHATLTPPTTIARPVDFVGGTDIIRNANAPGAAPSPGSYGRVDIKSGSGLTLSAGKYYFDSVNIETNAKLTLNTAGGPVFVFVRDGFNYKGVLQYSGSAAKVFFGVFGTTMVSLETVLKGTVVAPNATLRLAPAFKTFDGAFFGKAIQVEPDLTINHVPFAHWADIFPVVPSVVCVTRFTDTNFSAKFAYTNSLDVPVAIPFGSGNSFNPPVILGAGPTFQPGTHDFWVPYSGGSLAWTLSGTTVTATHGTTPTCTDDDYPPGDSPIPTGIIDPDSPKQLSQEARLLDLPDRGPDRPLSSQPRPSDGGNPPDPPPPIVPSFPKGQFAFRITHGQLGADDGSAGLRARVSINGQFAGNYHFGCFPDCIFPGGCVTPPIGQMIDTPDETFRVPVNLSAPVAVLVEYFDYDACNQDDPVGSVNLLFDPLSGQLLSGDNSEPTCDVSSSNWGVCFDGMGASEPPDNVDLTFIPQICATWRADYVDEGTGEDVLGRDIAEVLGGQQDGPDRGLEYEASFAQAKLSLSSASGATVWTGYLDAEGCIPQGELQARGLNLQYFMSQAVVTADPLWIRLEVISQFEREGVHWNVALVSPGYRSFDDPPVYDVGAKQKFLQPFVMALEQTKGDLAHFAQTSDGWFVPPPILVFNDGSLDDITRVSATVSRILRTQDHGIAPGDPYLVLANDGCPSPSLSTDSCFHPTYDTLFIGPATNGLPSQSHWKFITAHEAGHFIQNRAIGSVGNNVSYTFRCTQSDGTVVTQNDPCDAPSLCKCDHVAAANGLHCLQSLETQGKAQQEGFAQYYSSKIWNEPDLGGCGFGYYKEFLWPSGQCPPGKTCTPAPGGERDDPPVAVSCKAPALWRNRHCGVPSMATEFDWMSYLWNLDTVAPPGSAIPPIGLTGIYGVYTQACGGNCDGQVSFEEFAAGAEGLYGPLDPRRDHVVELGKDHGVGLDVSVP
jgi:hypothetical protein